MFEQPIAKEFQRKCLEAGLIVNAVDENTIRLVPPLVLQAADIERAGRIMKMVLGKA